METVMCTCVPVRIWMDLVQRDGGHVCTCVCSHLGGDGRGVRVRTVVMYIFVSTVVGIRTVLGGYYVMVTVNTLKYVLTTVD